MANKNGTVNNENVDEENVDVENQGTEDETGADQNEGSESGNNNANNGNNNESNKGGKSGKTFSQEQVTKMMTKEKNQGRNAVYKDLGLNPNDSKAIAAVKAFIESQKTDEDKVNEQNLALEEANSRARIAEAKAEAMMLGIKSQYVEDAVTLVMSKTKGDDDSDAIKTALGELKTKYPVWFGNEEADENNVGKRGTGSSLGAQRKQAGSKQGNGTGEKSLGERLAASRVGSKPKTSYWGNK